MKSNGRENNNISISINPEIREYSESVFWGLTLRQFLFSMVGCIASIGIFFLLRSVMGLEAVSWACITGMCPFAILGFVKYNGMPAEKVIAAIIRSTLLTPKMLAYKPVNLIEQLLISEDKSKGGEEGELAKKKE